MTAFTAFTDEIDSWWVRGPINFFDSGRAVAMRIEPGVDGRILEIYDEERGDALELGQITVWEPGARLVYRSLVDETEVAVHVRRRHVRDGLVRDALASQRKQEDGHAEGRQWTFVQARPTMT
jgi:hypothetical protein